MRASQNNEKPWITENFAEKFRNAFGRNMTADERRFFGLDEEAPEDEEKDNSAAN